MCGRYATTQTDAELRSMFHVEETLGEDPGPSYNVAPTQVVRTVLDTTPRHEPEADVRRLLTSARWGLIPSWAKDPSIGNRMINARSETITEKPAFKRAAVKRRCIVPASGYYEWEKREGVSKKIPHFLHDPQSPVIAMAGLYEWWRDPERADDDPDRWVLSITVLTTTATDATGHIHDRSPVVLPETFREHWLDPALNDPEDVKALVASVPEPHLATYEVSTAVNSVRNDAPSLLDPVG